MILTVKRLYLLWSQPVLVTVWYANPVPILHEVRTETESKCLETFERLKKIILSLMNLIKIGICILNDF